MGEQQFQTYTIAVDNAADYHIGGEVELETQQSNGFWAVFYGYVFPLVLMLAALILSLWLTQNEIYSGIISIIILIPYYFLLFLMRKYLKTKFVFRITKK